MGDHSHHPVDIDPQDLRRAQHNWAGFTQLLKYSIIGIVAILILLALAFIR
jgi:hypothetical protein